MCHLSAAGVRLSSWNSIWIQLSFSFFSSRWLRRRPPSFLCFESVNLCVAAAWWGPAPQISHWRIYQGMTNELSFHTPDYLTFICREGGPDETIGHQRGTRRPVARTNAWTRTGIKRELIKIGCHWGEVIENLTLRWNARRAGTSDVIRGTGADGYRTLKAEWESGRSVACDWTSLRRRWF